MNTTPFTMQARTNAKMLSDDRVFVLKLKDGEAGLTAKGAPDKRLFTGENNLHAVRDIRKGAWFLRYDNGSTPEGLKGEWTEWHMLEAFVRHYYDGRNVEVVDVT